VMKTMAGDIKLFFLNATTFALSLSDIDMILKILLLLVSIGYTIDKWMKINKKNEEDK
jgi:hypothetical protein